MSVLSKVIQEHISISVVEFDNLSIGRLVVICKDAAVGVFAFPQGEFAVNPLLRLYRRTCS